MPFKRPSRRTARAPRELVHSVPPDYFAAQQARRYADSVPRGVTCPCERTEHNAYLERVCVCCATTYRADYRVPDAWHGTSTVVRLHTYNYANYLAAVLRKVCGRVTQDQVDFVVRVFPRFYEAFFKLNPGRKGYTSYAFTVRRLLCFAGADVSALDSVRDPVTPRIALAQRRQWPEVCRLSGIKAEHLADLRPFRSRQRAKPRRGKAPPTETPPLRVPEMKPGQFKDHRPPAKGPKRTSGNFAVFGDNCAQLTLSSRPGVFVKTEYGTKADWREEREAYVKDRASDKKLTALIDAQVDESEAEDWLAAWEECAERYVTENLQTTKNRRLSFHCPFEICDGVAKMKAELGRDVLEECATSQGLGLEDVFELTHGTYRCVLSVSGVWHNAQSFGLKLKLLRLGLLKEEQGPSKRQKPEDYEWDE